MALLLDGREVAKAVKGRVAQDAEALAAAGTPARLATIRVGGSPDDVAYERSISKASASLGVECEHVVLPEDVAQDVLMSELARVNGSPETAGCMLFRPLPRPLDEMAACNAISPAKDVDGVGAASLAGVFMGLDEGFAPATAEACIAILDHYGIALEGAHVAVVGRSLVIGKPVGMLALGRNATVTYCHSRTAGLRDMTRSADIVICAVGRPSFFDGSYFRDDATQVVLDVGMNVDGEGRLCGDVDFADVEGRVAAITPVPGGVGSVTTSILLKHVVDARTRMTEGS